MQFVWSQSYTVSLNYISSFWFRLQLTVTLSLISFLIPQFVYSIVYNIVAYYAVFVHTGVTTYQGCLVIGICLAFQFLGHVILEGTTPQRLPTKEDNILFKVMDLANEFFFAPFHFSLTLMIRFDSLPILKWRSDAALHKLIAATQELKYGKKGP